MPSFKLKSSWVTILQGVEFSIFPLILAWALQQCSANALPVIKNVCYSNIIVDSLQGCGHSKKLRESESESRSSKVIDRRGVSCKNARTVQFSGGVEKCPVTQKTVNANHCDSCCARRVSRRSCRFKSLNKWMTESQILSNLS